MLSNTLFLSFIWDNFSNIATGIGILFAIITVWLKKKHYTHIEEKFAEFVKNNTSDSQATASFSHEIEQTYESEQHESSFLLFFFLILFLISVTVFLMSLNTLDLDDTPISKQPESSVLSLMRVNDKDLNGNTVNVLSIRPCHDVYHNDACDVRTATIKSNSVVQVDLAKIREATELDNDGMVKLWVFVQTDGAESCAPKDFLDDEPFCKAWSTEHNFSGWVNSCYLSSLEHDHAFSCRVSYQ